MCTLTETKKLSLINKDVYCNILQPECNNNTFEIIRKIDYTGLLVSISLYATDANIGINRKIYLI